MASCLPGSKTLFILRLLNLPSSKKGRPMITVTWDVQAGQWDS